MASRCAPPPFKQLLEKIYLDDFDGAVSTWISYCKSQRGCTRHSSDNPPTVPYCAEILHAALLGQSMGGADLEREKCHGCAQKLKDWITDQPT